ncbi:MAG TPA: type IV secretion system protein VirB10 [Steroidobacteraceae bacterium]
MAIWHQFWLPKPSDATRAVEGERGMPSIREAPALQTRINNILALGLMGAMGAAMLVTYYLHIARGRVQTHQVAQSSSERVRAEVAPPPLGAIEPSARAAVNLGEPTVPSDVLAQSPPPEPPINVPLQSSALPDNASVPRPSILDRRLSGTTFAHASFDAGMSATTADGRTDTVTVATPASGLRAAGPAAAAGGGVALATLLRTEPTGTAPARLLPTQRLLLPKGAFIDCTLETAIDSSLPGMTTCVTSADTFGADGEVVLMERGTKLVGETRGQVQQGTARIFVVWTEARTPTGVIVPLDSPAADALGRSGLAGTVDRHFWERFGAALFISTIDAAGQAAVESSSRGSGTLIYNPSGAQDVTTDVLRSTLAITPTVRKNNGDRIQVLVARDIDFSSVYELRRASEH